MYHAERCKKNYTREDLYRTPPFCIQEFTPTPPGYFEYTDILLKEVTFQQEVKQSLEENIRVEINSKKVIELPIKLSKLAKVIEESKYILELNDDFDEEESKGYQFATWERAIDFLVAYFKRVLDSYRITIDSPKIYHGPEGSIDILWKTESYKLLINIPEEREHPASFYGDNFKMNTIKGTFDTSKFNQGLLILLSELQ